jgi:hypothetical protein
MNEERRTTPPIRKVILWIGICTIALAVGWLLSSSRYTFIDGKVYTLVPDYNHLEPGSPHCMAFMPSCGYCVDIIHSGKDTLVQDGKCYRAL